jgi:branched-chain amino acid transport system permease protein
MGSLSGGIIAAIFLTFLPEYLRDFNQYRLLVYSLLLIVTMLYRQQGLLGTKEVSFYDLFVKINDKANKKKERDLNGNS